MSKKIFINNLNTFVSKALLEELKDSSKGEEGEENPDAPIIFGTYIDKDSSEKPEGVKKMLKVSYISIFVTTHFKIEIQAQTCHEVPFRV